MRARDTGREDHRRGWSGWARAAPTVPRCERCGKAHRADVGCWRGRRVTRLRVEVLAVLGSVCWLCGGEGADSLDHVIPRSLGGTDELGNLRPAHRACNARRGNRRGERTERIDQTSWFL